MHFEVIWSVNQHLLKMFKIFIHIYIYVTLFSNDSEIKNFCNIIHYTIQKLGVSIILFYFFGGKKLWKLILLFSKDALNWSKNDDKDVYYVTKDFYFR